jgi:16S rRNA (adenine1518-N6/adenine1519-N6)-dimethyltransferase
LGAPALGEGPRDASSAAQLRNSAASAVTLPAETPLGQASGSPSYADGLPTAPREIRELLRGLGLRPQKGFGQNFLTSEAVLGRIVDAAEVGSEDLVIEIGPGLGHLTRQLAARASKVVAVEIDRGLARRLRDAFATTTNVEIVERDILKTDPRELVDGKPFKVVANLPYYITSAALRHLLEAEVRPTRVVVMVQKEVADRILAPNGDLNLLAISIRVYGQPRLVTRVPPAAFYPQPSVESAVVRIDVFDRPAVDVGTDAFFRVVSAGFAAPRKQLHNSLAQLLWMPPGGAPEILRAAGVDPMRRPQTISIEEWARVTREMQARGLV